MSARIVKNMLLFSLLLIGFNAVARTQKETQEAAIMCTFVHGCLITSPRFFGCVPLPKCETVDVLWPFFANLVAHFVIRAINVNCIDRNSEIMLNTAIAANMLNISLIGYTIWQRHQKYCQRNQTIVSLGDIALLRQQEEVILAETQRRQNEWIKNWYEEKRKKVRI